MSSDGGSIRSVKSRVTLVTKLYHQGPADDATMQECGWDSELESDEQVYIRRLLVTYEWKKLDTGWVHDPLVVWIECVAGTTLELGLGCMEPMLLVPKLAGIPLMPVPGMTVYVRTAGESRCKIAALPR